MQRYQQVITDLYRLTAPRYERDIGPIMGPLARALVAQAELEPTAAVLDIGTGTGILLREIASPVRHSIGVDIALPMLRTAAGLRAAQRWPRTSLVATDANRLDALADDCCDVAFASFGLSECEPIPALRAAARVLRPGGRLYLQEWGPYDGPADPRAIIDETLAAYITEEADALRAAFRTHLAGPRPWDRQLQDADDYAEALRESGFRDVRAAECRAIPLLAGGSVDPLLTYALAWAPRALELEALSPRSLSMFLKEIKQCLTLLVESNQLLPWTPLLFQASGISVF